MFSIATAITRIYPLSLHDALPILMVRGGGFLIGIGIAWRRGLIRLDAPDWRALPTVFRVGAPLSLAGVLLSVVYMWLTRYTSRFGTAALAALGVGHKVEGLGFIAISGFAPSASALVGQNLGAQQEARARQAVRMTVGYCLVATTVTAVAFLTIPETLVALFTPDPAVIADGDRKSTRLNSSHGYISYAVFCLKKKKRLLP